MTALQIILILVGCVCLVGSFFVSEKLSSSDLEEMKKMSEQELKVLVEQKLQDASSNIDTHLQEVLDEKIQELERRSDKETNDKIMAIGEYADTVFSSMNKSHEEIVFLYDMLNDKHAKVTELTREMQAMESSIQEMLAELEEKMQHEIELAEVEDSASDSQEVSIIDALQSQVIEQEHHSEGDNAEILELYKEGLSEVEIAKTLGRGLGEVKLVLGLFSEGVKS